MAHRFFILPIAILLCACSSPTNSKQEVNVNDTLGLDSTQNDSKLDLPQDTPMVNHKPVNETWQVPERFVYSVNTLSDGKDLNISFISLTDVYEWTQEQDSMIIEEKFLLKPSQAEYSMHTIGPEKRTMFLKRVGIRETDSIYIYFLKDHRMETYAVNELPLTGLLSPYISDSDFPVPEHYFMIGFNLNTKTVDQLMTYVRSCLVNISATNPFNVGGAECMEFKQISKAEYPDTTGSKEHNLNEFYVYSNELYDYYIHDRGEDYLSDRRIMVQSNLDGQIEFDKWYMEGEGVEIVPIIMNDNPYGPSLWTGKVFKNKPYILMGMQSQSFGCPKIDLIGSDESIYIHCDNRH